MREPRDNSQMQAARRRDGNECRKCGMLGPRLDVHHIDGNASNNELNNLITLCHICHPAGMDAAEFCFWLETWPTWKEVMKELYRLGSLATGDSVSHIDFDQYLGMDAVDKAWHGWLGETYRKGLGAVQS